MNSEQERQVMIHEKWIAFRRQYNTVNEPHGINITNEEVEKHIKIKMDEARRDFAEEIDEFLIKTATEDDTVRLRKLNDLMIKEKELKP